MICGCLGSAFPPTYRNPAPYLESITAIEALEPEWLLAAHEPPMRAAEAQAFLARSRSFARTLERLALEELESSESGLSTNELIEILAPQVGSWDAGVWMFLANELVGHLEELAAAGVIRERTGPPTTWHADGEDGA